MHLGNPTDGKGSLYPVVANEFLVIFFSKNNILSIYLFVNYFNEIQENGYIKPELLLSNNGAVKNPCDLHRQFKKPILLGALAQVYLGHYPGDDLKPCSGLAMVESVKMYHVYCDLAHTFMVKNSLNCKCVEFLIEKCSLIH